MTSARVLPAGLLLLGLVVGCLPQQTATNRGQAADDQADADRFATIGQRTAVGNVDPIPVSGVGLVHHLNGTGSSPPHDALRATLEAAIRRDKGNPKDLLDGPNKTTSLVLVSAVIPAGARAGDKIDVAVSLPPGSKTTSLKGGILEPCDLTNRELAGNVRASMSAAGVKPGNTAIQDNAVLNGHRMARAAGHLIAGHDGPKPADGGDGPTGPRSARVWGGGKNLLDRPYYFLLNDTSPQPRLAMVIAERLNSVFHAPGDRLGGLAKATVQGKPLVTTFVPPAYRLNHARFLTVARQVPLSPVESDSPYRKQLENDLLAPELALVSAVKLEALGTEGRQPLRVGLQSDNPWVRFASAEALAYLGHPDGVKVLAEMAANHPAVRTQSLTALASLDDAVCVDALVELMKHSDPAVRYGAFAALRSADDNHEAIRGTRVNGSYTLHRVAPDAAEPMIHVSVDRRAEIVLFGAVWPLKGSFSFPLGADFTVAARDGEPGVTVTRLATKNGEPVAVPVKCRADAGAVLQALGDLGGSLTEAVEFLRRAEQAEVLVADLKFDAAPRGLTIQQLAAISRSDQTLGRADLEVSRVGQADVVQASHDLPTEADAVQARPKVEYTAPALNREPGRIFGKK
jgi:hypothetical protein